MKLTINENKLESIIENYLNTLFDVKNINYTGIEDYDGYSDDAYEFYYGDYSDDETVFRLYYESYWANEDDYRKKLSPILVFENDNDYSSLVSLFNNFWEPVFKKWFMNNFGFEIKSFDGYS